MRAQLTTIVLACVIALGPSYGDEKDAAGICRGDWTTPFANGQPFLLKDRRSGSFLYVESDNRHMSAIAPDGRLLWYRNLFDRKIQRFFVPPPNIEGEPSSLFDKELQRHAQLWANELGINRIGIAPDCQLRFIDHNLRLRSHYVRAGSGTHIFWLIDAKTGDIQMEAVN